MTLNNIGITYIGIGKHGTPNDQTDRTHILRSDRLNLRCAVKQIQQISLINNNNTNNTYKNSWTSEEIFTELEENRQSFNDSKYDAFITFIVTHGENNGISNNIITSDDQKIQYENIKKYFQNDNDIASVSYKPRLVIFYTCKSFCSGSGKTNIINSDSNSNNNINSKIIKQISGNYPGNLTNTTEHNKINGVRKAVDNNATASWDNVTFIEAAPTYHKVASFPYGTGAVMSVLNYFRIKLSEDESFTFESMCTTVRKDIRELHRQIYQCSITPGYYTPGINDTYYITPTRTNSQLSINEIQFTDSIKELLNKCGNKYENRKQRFKSSDDFIQHKLQKYITDDVILFIFKKLSNGQRYVTYDAFINHFLGCVSGEYKSYLSKHILSEAALDHLLNDFMNDNDEKWEIDVDEDDKPPDEDESRENGFAVRVVDATIFQPLYNIYDKLLNLIKTQSVQKLITTGKLFYMPQFLGTIKEWVNDLETDGDNPYLGLICDFNTISKTNDSMLLLIPIENENDKSFCGIIRITKQESLLKMDSLLGSMTSRQFGINIKTLTNQPKNIIKQIDKNINKWYDIAQTFIGKNIIELQQQYIHSFINNNNIAYNNFQCPRQVYAKYKLKGLHFHDCHSLMLHNKAKYNLIGPHIGNGMIACVVNKGIEDTQSLDIVNQFQRNAIISNKSNESYIMLIVGIFTSNDDEDCVMKCYRWQKPVGKKKVYNYDYDFGNWIVKETKITNNDWFTNELTDAIDINTNGKNYLWIKNGSQTSWRNITPTNIHQMISSPLTNNTNNNNNSNNNFNNTNNKNIVQIIKNNKKSKPIHSSSNNTNNKNILSINNTTNKSNNISGFSGSNGYDFGGNDFGMNDSRPKINKKRKRRRPVRTRNGSAEPNNTNNNNGKTNKEAMDCDYDSSDNDIIHVMDFKDLNINITNNKNNKSKKRKRDNECVNDGIPNPKRTKINQQPKQLQGDLSSREEWIEDWQLTTADPYYDFIYSALKNINDIITKLRGWHVRQVKKEKIKRDILHNAGFICLTEAIDGNIAYKRFRQPWPEKNFQSLPKYDECRTKEKKYEIKGADWKQATGPLKCESFNRFCQTVGKHYWFYRCPICFVQTKKINQAKECVKTHRSNCQQ